MSYKQEIIITGNVMKATIKEDVFSSGKEYIDFIFNIMTRDGVELYCKKRFFNVNKHSIDEAKSFIKHSYNECVRISNVKGQLVKITCMGDFNGFSEFNSKKFLSIDKIESIEDDSDIVDSILLNMIVKDMDNNKITLSCGKEDYETVVNVELSSEIENKAKIGQGYSFSGKLVASKQQNPGSYSWEAVVENDDYKIIIKPVGILLNYYSNKFKSNTLNLPNNKDGQVNEKIKTTDNAF